MGILFAIFVITPIVEMYVLIRVGEWLGALPTIGLVFLTAVVGLGLLRLQGFATLARGMGRLNAGELPAHEMLEGLVLAIGGALLLTPGFVTDGVGFACLLPPSRRAFVALLIRRGQARAMGRSTRYDASGDGRPGAQFGAGRPRRGRRSDVLEGEFRHEQDRDRGSGREYDDDRDDHRP